MKKQITILFLVITMCLQAFSQQKIDSASKAKEDSTTYVTKILSLQDIDRIMQTKKQNISAYDWDIFWKAMNQLLLPDAIKEYQAGRQSAIKSAAKKP